MHNVHIPLHILERVAQRRGPRGAFAEAMIAHSAPRSSGYEIGADMGVRGADTAVGETRYRALIAASSDLGERLRARRVDTVLITGTLTNVCCESTTRDAMIRVIGDVVTTDQVLARLEAGAAAPRPASAASE
jgi:ureidoacrylate peracid hydrolase